MTYRSAAKSGSTALTSAKKPTKQYKRLVLGKEVRLRNAYVIKAERVEDAEGEYHHHLLFI